MSSLHDADLDVFLRTQDRDDEWEREVERRAEEGDDAPAFDPDAEPVYPD